MPKDAISLIEADHREVEGLFAQLKQATGQQRGQIFEKIARELTLHTEAEEKAVYPAVKKDVSDGKELVDEANHEHDEAKELIEQLLAMDPADEQFLTLAAELEGAVNHHVQEEETEMLPKLRESASSDELVTLGEKFEQAKQKAQFGGGTKSSTKGGGKASADDDLESKTKDELLEMAKEIDLTGRHDMKKDELIKALRKA